MNTWEFDTTIGQGSEVVTVVYEYEMDEDKSTYNESVNWSNVTDLKQLLEKLLQLDLQEDI